MAYCGFREQRNQPITNSPIAAHAYSASVNDFQLQMTYKCKESQKWYMAVSSIGRRGITECGVGLRLIE